MNATVLTVEAQPRLHPELEKVATRMHDRCISVRQPDEALEVLQAESIDVLIVDDGLPGSASLELIDEVRRRWPTVLRILLTDQAEASDELLDMVHEGILDRFITRPTNPSELAQTLRQMLKMNELKRESRRLLETFRDETEVFDVDVDLDIEPDEPTAVFTLDGEDTPENVDELLDEIRSELDRRPPDLWT